MSFMETQKMGSGIFNYDIQSPSHKFILWSTLKHQQNSLEKQTFLEHCIYAIHTTTFFYY